MSRASVTTSGAVRSGATSKAHLVDRSPEIETALEALSALERRYLADRERLMRWPDPEGIKEAFLEQLEARHARERQPLIQRLAYLQRTATTARMLGSLVTVH